MYFYLLNLATLPVKPKIFTIWPFTEKVCWHLRYINNNDDDDRSSRIKNNTNNNSSNTSFICIISVSVLSWLILKASTLMLVDTCLLIWRVLIHPGLPTFLGGGFVAYHCSFPQAYITPFRLSHSRNKSRHPVNHYRWLYLIPWLTDSICLLYVSNNCSVISGLFYLRVVFIRPIFMHWITSMQTSRGTLWEASFDMNKHWIEMSSGQSSQLYLQLWSSPLVAKPCSNCASLFTHFSPQHICENTLIIMYWITTRFGN